jgi:cytochrome c553
MAAAMRWPALGRTAACLAVAALVLAGAGFLFALTGLYDIAASREHLAPTRAFLELAKRRSVAVHAALVQVPRLDDDDLVRLGAGHFASGCAPCHGAPGVPVGPIARRMQPAAPDLARIAPTWSSKELFWIVKNGLKYTGMPAWPTQQRDDEVWAAIAFLRALPSLDAASYRTLVRREQSSAHQREPGIAGLDPLGPQASDCARCHGNASASPASPLVPGLNGQSAPYLVLSLANYAEGRRPSGVMQPIAAALDADSRARLADFYAKLAPATRAASPAMAGQIDRGHRIATAGVPGSGIPPCLTCHGGAGLATYPRLAGQSATYLVGQLRLLQLGTRAGSPQGAIMTPIARLLSPDQIEDVAIYFDSLRDAAPDAGDGPKRPRMP